MATILVGLFGDEAAGVKVVCSLPSGLPQRALPDLDPATLWELVPGALAIVLVGYAEALGGAKAAAMQDGGDIDPNQELVAHGPENILAAYSAASSRQQLPKTSVAMAAGGPDQQAGDDRLGVKPEAHTRSSEKGQATGPRSISLGRRQTPGRASR